MDFFSPACLEQCFTKAQINIIKRADFYLPNCGTFSIGSVFQMHRSFHLKLLDLKNGWTPEASESNQLQDK